MIVLRNLILEMSQNNIGGCGFDANGCNGGMQLRSQTNRQLRTKRQKDIKELFEKYLFSWDKWVLNDPRIQLFIGTFLV